VKNKYFKQVSNQKLLEITLFVSVLLLMLSCGTSPEGSGAKVSAPEVKITPQFVTVVRGDTQLFQAKETVTTSTGSSTSATINMDPTTFTWEIQEGFAGGTLIRSPTQPGFFLYTAPAAPGKYHVVVTSRRDPSQSDIAEVEVK
jgi:hypothetical protein